MKFLRADAPQFLPAEVENVLAQQYGLRGALTPLYSERDQNYRLLDMRGTAWTVKIANLEEDPAIIEAQIGALAHIARIDPALPVPRLRPLPDGGKVAKIQHQNGNTHPLYVLSYLPGEIVEKVRRMPDLPVRLGQMLARLGQAMRDYDHPAAYDRGLLWDPRQAPRFLPEIDRLERQQDRDLARRILTDIAGGVLPRLASLRHQLIHGDVNEHNFLANPKAPYEITGIIDFGDMIHAPLVQDIANLAADFMVGPDDALTTLCGCVAGYHAVTPLQEAEVAVIFDLVEIRLLLAPLINQWRSQETPDAPNYMHGYTKSCLATGHALQAIGREAVTRRLREICGFPAMQAETAIESETQGPPLDAVAGDILRRRHQVLGRELA
ncbi:MAG: phosphotransferase, partial [Dongiaceae bacterium]